jgi:hypothetical protein
MAKANRITTPSQIMTQYDTTLSQESKDTKNFMVQEQDHHVPEKTVYSSPARPQTARGRFRSEQSKQQTIREDDREEDTSPPIPSSSLVDESTRPFIKVKYTHFCGLWSKLGSFCSMVKSCTSSNNRYECNRQLMLSLSNHKVNKVKNNTLVV